MPYIKTVAELVEDLADKFGVYGPIPEGDHPDDCRCRICFTAVWTERIRRAVHNEQAVDINERIATLEAEVDRMAGFTGYKRFTHEEYGIDYNAMNLVDDFSEQAPLLWLVEKWIMQESTRAVGANGGLARMLAARLRHELGLQKVERGPK